MCGIAVVLSSRALSCEYLTKAEKLSTSFLSRRGPDYFGKLYIYRDISGKRLLSSYSQPRSNQECIGLLFHSRLLITGSGLDDGAQPFISSSGRYVFVFNGEIYNYRQIGRDILNEDFSSDTACLSAILERLGIDCFRLLVGMYAAVIIDMEQQIAYECRDTFGIKPMFYSQDSTTLFLSSSAMLAAALSAKGMIKLNDKRKRDFINSGKTIFGSGTFLAGVFRSNKGIYARSLMSLRRRVYIAHAEPLTYSHVTPNSPLEEQIISSIISESDSSLDVAVLLSGGIDSSVVAAVSSQNAHVRLCAYTGVSTGENSELETAASTAHNLGIIHKAVKLEKDWDSLIGVFSKYSGYPVKSTSHLLEASLYGSIAADGIRLVMTGHGADELFCGYAYMYPSMQLFTLLLSGSLSKLRSLSNLYFSTNWPFRQIVYASVRYFVDIFRLCSPKGLVLVQAFGLSIFHPCRLRSCVQSFMADHLEDELTYADISSMLSSIEARVPLINQSHILGAVKSNKFDRGHTKSPLRTILSRYGFSTIASQIKKLGFEASSHLPSSNSHDDILSMSPRSFRIRTFKALEEQVRLVNHLI